MKYTAYIYLGFIGVAVITFVWNLISLRYITLHYNHIQKRIEEIHDENVKRINSGNYDDLIDYNIIDKEPSPYWIVRVNQKLGWW